MGITALFSGETRSSLRLATWALTSGCGLSDDGGESAGKARLTVFRVNLDSLFESIKLSPDVITPSKSETGFGSINGSSSVKVTTFCELYDWERQSSIDEQSDSSLSIVKSIGSSFKF